MTYQRRLSATEIMLALGGCTFEDSAQKINQFVVEGSGDISEAALSRVIEQLAQSLPDSTVVLKGFWGFKKWKSTGKAPKVKVITSDWDGHSNHGADFLDQPMDIRKGPTTEIILVRGEITRLVVRAHHAVMDGMGTHTYVKNIFKGLRGEAIDSSTKDIIAEDLIKDIHCEHRDDVLQSALSLTGGKVDSSVPLERVWRRFTLAKNDFRLLPKAIFALATIAREHGDGAVRINIPVDLRRHVKDLIATPNLSGIMLLNVDSEDTMRSIAKAFNRKLSKNHEIANINEGLLKIAPWVPFPMAKSMTQKDIQRQVYSDDIMLTGYISVMDNCETKEFSSEGFTASTAYFIPLHTYTVPMFMTMWSNENGAELCVGAPSVRCSNGRLEEFASKLETLLS